MSKFQVGDMLRFKPYRRETDYYCIVLETSSGGGVVMWYKSAQGYQLYEQPVDWDSLYGEYTKVA